jgi:palmitoyl-protein thioesterase
LTENKLHYEIYLHRSDYLPYINNEKAHDKADQYKQRFSALDRIGLYSFANDTVVYPLMSEQFGEIDLEGKTLSMRETRLYNEDWIGLKTLDTNNKVYMRTILGDHLKFKDNDILGWFIPFLYDGSFKPSEE